jgi:hypothetical protein
MLSGRDISQVILEIGFEVEVDPRAGREIIQNGTAYSSKRKKRKHRKVFSYGL